MDHMQLSRGKRWGLNPLTQDVSAIKGLCFGSFRAHLPHSSFTMLRFLVLATLVLSGLCLDVSLQNGTFQNGTRVIGGSQTFRNAWPSMVTVQFAYGGYWYHNGGGILITTNWVLTSAKCVDSNLPYPFRVVLGDHNIQLYDGTEQYISVYRIVRHPNWNTNNIVAGYDIALLKLATPAILNRYVQLAQLPPVGQLLANNYPCIITGWGWITNYGPASPTLQQASIPVVDQSTCSSAFYWGSTVKTTMVCAGGDGLHAGCMGDGGGPLYCPVSGVYYVHGITSFVAASGCNTYLKPTVFTRVSAYIPWINSVIFP